MFLVDILLPLDDDRGEPFPADYYNELAQRLTERFGGVTSFTRSPGEGRWKNRGTTDREEIVVIEVMTEKVDRRMVVPAAQGPHAEIQTRRYCDPQPSHRTLNITGRCGFA